MKKMENISLPEAFVEKMSRLLGDGAGNFFESYERERSFGLRVNPLKAGERLPGLLSGLERIPWSRGAGGRFRRGFKGLGPDDCGRLFPGICQGGPGSP